MEYNMKNNYRCIRFLNYKSHGAHNLYLSFLTLEYNYIGHIADTLGVSIEDLFIERPTVTNHRIPRR